MRMRLVWMALLIFVFAHPGVAGLAQSKEDEAKESHHHAGPGGLEGWTVREEIEEQGMLPSGLVIARGGRVIRRIEGDPFVWSWMFVADGKQVAYQTGPLHFAMSCVLVDVSSGKQLAMQDCFAEPVRANAPHWVKRLKSRAAIAFPE